MLDTDVEIQMEALRRRLTKAVKVDRIATYKELSLALGQNQTFIQQFVTKKSPRRLYDEQVEVISKIIEDRASASTARPSPSAGAASLSTMDIDGMVERLKRYPDKLVDRVISFAEFEMQRYDRSDENDTRTHTHK